jgi:lipid A disaccharide synthetase
MITQGRFIMETEDFVIITNSPGEVSSWVRTTTESLKHYKPEARIIVALVPCPYATGREKEIASSFPYVDIVLSPMEYIKMCIGLRQKSYIPSRKGIVIFLGGDFWHAILLAWRLRFPAAAYAVRISGWSKYFEQLFVVDDRARESFIAQGIPMERIEVVGNLMRDGVKASTGRVEALKGWGLDPGRMTVSLFPGSRIVHVEQSLPVFLKVAEELHEQMPELQFLLSISPFIHLEEILRCLKNSSPQGIEGATGDLDSSRTPWQISTDKGVKVALFRDCQYDLINASDLILTIPGTNTAEIAALGKPMIVSFSWRARLPRGGLGFFLNFLPLDWPIRRAIMHKAFEKVKFKALPNQWADREIVPEVKLEKKAEEITRVAMNLLKDSGERERISKELLEILGSQGAADKIAQKIASL